MKAKKIVIISILILISLGIISLGLFFSYLYIVPTNIDKTKLTNNQKYLTILDVNNELFPTKLDNYVTIQEIPTSIINAFISVEDKRFYGHSGVDYMRILGAIRSNTLYHTKQGASTITQQLIKNVYLTSDKSINRKLLEIRMAIKLEKELSKNEILEKYLNILYFGSGEYGIKNAARRFFNKNLSDLSYKECAILAGIVKSPTKYNPINNYDNSIERANIVLKLMFEQNKISESEYKTAIKELPVIKNALIYNNFDYKYSENVYFEASKLLGIDSDELPYLKLKIYTYMDPLAQKAIFNTINDENYYSNLESTNSNNGIGLAVDNSTCGIKAYHSNLNINISEFYRSPGSTIKPFLAYAPAFESGKFQLFSKVNNSFTQFNDYSPNNYNDYYTEYETLLDSISNSYNVPAVTVLNEIGIDNAKKYLDKIDIHLPTQDNNLALALGGLTYGITPINILSMYTTIANDGHYSKIQFIREIRDENNKIIFSNNKINNEVITKETSDLLKIALKDCAINGTANKLSVLNYDIASKTGTVGVNNSDKNSDIYNVSFTSNDSILFWQGSLNSNELLPKNMTGGGATTTMARDFLNKLYAQYTPVNFIYSKNIQNIFLDKTEYLNNVYKIADDLCPSSQKISVVANSRTLNLEKDKSYTEIRMDVNEIYDGTNRKLEITLNPRLRYKIYKRQLFQEELLQDIYCKSGTYLLDISETPYAKYIIIPYYIDDDNNEILGLPYKYENPISILDANQQFLY